MFDNGLSLSVVDPCRLSITHSQGNKLNLQYIEWGGAVASWLVHSTPDRAARVQDLAGDIALCSWARHYSHSASLHPG